MKTPAMSPEQIAEAKSLRQHGATWLELGGRYDVDESTVRRAVKGGRVRRPEKPRAYRERRKPASELERPTYVNRLDSQTRADAERLMREIPRDTRDLTGVLMGDPIPGRRALDARQGA
jgi:hypothetical protein